MPPANDNLENDSRVACMTALHVDMQSRQCLQQPLVKCEDLVASAVVRVPWSSLNRPHPPHSQAHHDFTAWRLIRDAFAVRERLGDPRVVPGFHCSFLPGMPSSMTPGSSTSIYSRAAMP